MRRMDTGEPLSNPRWERYCQERAAGLTQRQAMLRAYPSRAKWKPETIDQHACRLEADGKVKARLTALERAAADAATITRAEVISGMGRTFRTASGILSKQPEGGRLDNAAVNAVSQLGRTLLDALPPDTADGERLWPWPGLPAALIGANYFELNRDVDAGAHDEYLLTGGRGSLKSSFVYLKALDLWLRDPEAHMICLRRVANTLRRSCYSGILWAAGMLGIRDRLKATVSPMQVVNPETGQLILFSGVDEPEKLKSIIPETGRLKIAVWEEYDQQDGPESVRTVEQSIIRSDEFTSFKAFNPPADPDHWANLDAAREDVPGRVRHHSTYLEAPPEWLGSKFLDLAEALKLRGRMVEWEGAEVSEAYLNEFLGIATGLTGQVFANVEAVEVAPEDAAAIKWVRCGVDWGYESDPFVWLRVGYDRKTRVLWILDELFNTRTLDADNAAEVMERLREPDPETGAPGRFLRGKPENQIRCDAAAPKDIATWRTLGLDAVAASKRVPVADGIRWLQRRAAIRIDRRRCPLAYQEFTRYRADEDEQGRFTGYPDRDNHTIDAVRYAVFDLIADEREV